MSHSFRNAKRPESRCLGSIAGKRSLMTFDGCTYLVGALQTAPTPQERAMVEVVDLKVATSGTGNT